MKDNNKDKENNKNKKEEEEKNNDDKRVNEEEDNRLADLIIDLITKDSTILFKDQYGVPFAHVFKADHYETVRIGSGKFRHYLGYLYHRAENRVANSEALRSAVQLLQGIAEYQGETIPLSLRVAWYDNSICYDLTNDNWQYVKISKDGWELINNGNKSRPLFNRFNQTAQVIPDRSYGDDVLDRFLDLTNLKNEKDRILVKVYIISFLRFHT